MRKSTFNWKAVLMVLIMIAPVLAKAFEPAKGLSKGTIHLKGGEVIKGQVAPLGQFPENGTLFVADQGGKQTMIAHNRIEKVVIDNKTYVPSMIELNGNKVAAYLEQKTSGSANLYKAYFYSLDFICKAVTALPANHTVHLVMMDTHAPTSLTPPPCPSLLHSMETGTQ